MLYGRMVCISRLQISSPSRARKITTMVLGMSDIAAGVFSYTAHALRFAFEVEGSTKKR